MGRYCGEEYEEKPPCPPDKHNFAINGNCWKCDHNRETLLRQAENTIKILGAKVVH